jgi:DamX protein
MDTEERLTEDTSSKSGGPLFFTGRGEAFPFFSSPELSQRLDLLRHLTENSDLIPLVKGPEGSGKSSLIQQLIRLASDNWVIANIEANPMMQPDQLLAALAETFPGAGQGHPIDRLIKRFGHLRQEGLLPVVIIDDAQLLPEATIITLLRMYERRQDENVLVRILLFAQPEIDNLLKTPQIQAMNMLSLQALDMPRLTEQQSREFVKQLLLAEDSTGRLGLSSSRIDKIFRESDGLPGRIAGQVLEAIGAGAAKPQSTGKVGLGSPLVVAGLISIVVILALMLLFQDSINAIFGGAEDSERAVSALPADGGKVVPLQLPTLEPAQPVPSGDRVTSDADVTADMQQPATTQPPALETPEQAATQAPGAPVSVELPVVSNEGPDADAPAPEQETTAEVAPEPTPAISSAPAPAPAAEITPAPVAEKGLAQEKTDKIDASGPAPVAGEQVVAAQPEPERKSPEPAVETAKTVSVVKPGSEAWLLQQNPNAYTLQLIGVQDEAGVSRFLERYKLPGQTAYFRTSRQGKPWFPVLYGVFPNRDAAVAAKDRLPESLKRSGVWPRSLESVQKEIQSR